MIYKYYLVCDRGPFRLKLVGLFKRGCSTGLFFSVQKTHAKGTLDESVLDVLKQEKCRIFMFDT